MQEEIINIKNEALSQIIEAKSKNELEDIRVIYLGRQGRLNKLTKEIKNLGKDERKKAGFLINESKNTILRLLVTQRNKLQESAREWFDPTTPGIKPKRGRLHLVTQAIEEIKSVFEKIGFVRVRYPEVEWDFLAFGSLNFTKDHPARDNWETFFIDTQAHPTYGPMLLTPHTSSGQVREMWRVRSTSPSTLSSGPNGSGFIPIRMINIAKCYRRQSDVSHVPMFHQFEGLVIDREISMVHLKGTLDYFARNFFGEDRKTRLRPYNFPFTEPSFEVDINCGLCKGKGCKFCKAGWHELGGAGMVHPTVLKNGGIDPRKYTGFAFGWGVERVMMMKSGLEIPDIRLLYSSDLRFLKQF